jgi:RimJ/RimL family protein N-acetyltransferase
VLTGCHSHLKLKNDECEIGFWIGVPYQNNGYATEACMEIIRHCFEKLNFNAVWCGYYDGNEKSRRVQEKCGFEYVHSNQNAYCDLMGEVRTEHFSKLTFFNYKNRK